MSGKPKQPASPKSGKQKKDPLKGKKIEPVNGHVLLELLEKDSSLYVPADLKDREFQGKVVALASDVDTGFDMKVGDYVVFEKFADSAIDKIPYGKRKNDKGEQETVHVTLIKDKLIMGVWR